MGAVGQSLRNAGVAAIYLIHGTFIGPDALGLLANLARIAPGLADTLRVWNKQLLDSIAGDLGNFTTEYAETWQSAINSPGVTPIPVQLFHWSSENHHLGRADGAVRLLSDLIERHFVAGNRVLLLGHSHGGNLLALLTNLLGSDRETRCAFFKAARIFYYLKLFKRIDLPVWDAMQRLACNQDELFPGVHFDMVTMGTPVRYGWDLGGCDHLLHFTNHRPVPGFPEYQAVFPPSADELWHATHGDFVQQIGIAGTNFSPPIWAWRACDADIRLGRLLQMEESVLDLLARLKLGVRAHADGENLFVDYGDEAGLPTQHLFGHAIYTRLDWMLFHAEQIAQRMYGLTA
jgi:hypothetical protein